MNIILWALAFWVITVIVGTVVFQTLKIGGMAWPPPVTVTEIWTVISLGSPLVGLSLGSRGILPGTAKANKNP
jgi:hypothetical protein